MNTACSSFYADIALFNHTTPRVFLWRRNNFSTLPSLREFLGVGMLADARLKGKLAALRFK